MPTLKIGIELASLGMPLRKALHTAARLGCSGVKIDARREVRPQEMTGTALRQFRKLLEELNLGVSAVVFPTRRGYDDAEDLEERVAATKAAMKFAYQIGAATVVGQVGHVPGDEACPSWNTLIEALTDLGAYGHHVGTTWTAKTGTVAPEDLARLLEALPDATMGIDLDPGRLTIQGFSPTDAAALLGSHILHVTANDAVADMPGGRGQEVELGRGSVDYPALMGQLEERPYRGWFTVERHGSNDPVGEIGNAVAYLQNIQQS